MYRFIKLPFPSHAFDDSKKEEEPRSVCTIPKKNKVVYLWVKGGGGSYCEGEAGREGDLDARLSCGRPSWKGWGRRLITLALEPRRPILIIYVLQQENKQLISSTEHLSWISNNTLEKGNSKRTVWECSSAVCLLFCYLRVCVCCARACCLLSLCVCRLAFRV